MMWLAIMTVLMVIMIWGDLGYGGGAFLVAVLFVAGGWAALIHWAGGKSQDAGTKQNHTSPHSAKSARPASSSRPASSNGSRASDHAAASDACIAAGIYAGIYSENGRISGTGIDDKWDNSDEAGGLPRSVSPFSDIDDPYDRMALEDEMFHEDFEMLSGGDPFGGGWLGEDD